MADLTDPEPSSRDAKAFLDGMRYLGWRDGENITIERRSAEGQPDRYDGLIQELVKLRVDLVVVNSSEVARRVKLVSDTMPVVLAGGSPDALVQEGLVASLGRPGGTVTGLVFDTGRGIEKKRLQLLKETVPRISRIAYLAGPQFLRPPTEAARALNLTLFPASVGDPEAFDSAFAAIGRQRADAILPARPRSSLGTDSGLSTLPLASACPSCTGIGSPRSRGA